MAAAALRHYSVALSGTSATTLASAVPSSRALVGKVVVAASAATNITITVGGVDICTALPMTAGQVYTETGVVVLATETVTVTSSVAGAARAHVFGEEVDN